MADSYQDVADEARQRAARLEGELAAAHDQLAAAIATETQLRQELDASRTEAAVARAELGHVQRHTELRVRQAQRENQDLRERLDEALRRAREADEQRGVVIASLGRRARRGRSRTPAGPLAAVGGLPNGQPCEPEED